MDGWWIFRGILIVVTLTLTGWAEERTGEGIGDAVGSGVKGNTDGKVGIRSGEKGGKESRGETGEGIECLTCGAAIRDTLRPVTSEMDPDQWPEVFADRTRLPDAAKSRVWWWWLNSNVDEAAITRDLEQMAEKGIGGLNLIDAGGAARPDWSQEVPVGPGFGSPRWRELFLHALNEAKRLNIEVGLNIQSGWNLGDPEVTPEQACKYVTTSETRVEIDADDLLSIGLPQPKVYEDFYRDIAVIAFPVKNPEGVSVRCTADTSQNGFPATRVLDGSVDTF
ncbi:MAG: glycosyl hydrolase, partial [Planctomycetia bacterium]|nr:glycosyl hydrolase [Planctomycetia bacterium]